MGKVIAKCVSSRSADRRRACAMRLRTISRSGGKRSAGCASISSRAVIQAEGRARGRFGTRHPLRMPEDRLRRVFPGWLRDEQWRAGLAVAVRVEKR